MINALKEIRILDKRIKFYDHKNSRSVYTIGDEIKKDYFLNQIKIEDGDVIIDIGAHVGVISTQMSKMNPKCKIYSFEPTANSFYCLNKNLKMNKIKNVKPYNKAVTSDGRNIQMRVSGSNTGGSTHVFTKNKVDLIHYFNTVESISINDLISDVLKIEGVDKIKILKIDCEGAEYEILNSLKPELFSKIEYMLGEFHTIFNDTERTPEKLIEHCEQYIDPKKLKIAVL
jgi:FkbM family methyltransferase